ncbi:hypothetical protein CTI12_AA118640 [Artemisia annua]|uniref:Replication factor-A protein 1 N-terminal domain-containing protein n=1 Tax=Artemisia annua TaxID=35608 RepID=A0A2U1PS86_ARTAN|nr:hypothetical protein CTI12_AA118640 [Artemisia annua]
MAVYLTPGAISEIMTGKCTWNDFYKPVLQVTHITRRTYTINNKQWYAVGLSDGSFRELGYIADDMVISNKLQKGSILLLTNFHLTEPLSFSFDFIGISKCDIIGKPKIYIETILVERCTPTIPDEDCVDPDLNENIDDGRHVEEPPTSKQKPSASTQKCPFHSISQNNTDTIMGVNLTPGAITKIMTDKCSSTDLKPVVQVTDILSGRISTKNDKQCYRKIVLSDGSSSHFGCIADDICISNKLQKGSIVQLTKFHVTKFSINGNIRVLLINDLKVIHSECDLIGNPESFPCNDTPLVERSTSPIPDEDHVDVSQAQKSMTSTQKCSETQSRKRKHQSSNETPESDTNEDVGNSHDAQEPSATKQKTMMEKNKQDDVGACFKKLEALEEDVSKMARMAMEKNKEDDVGACFKKLETLEKDISKVSRMMMEKNKEDDVRACFKKLETLEEDVSKLTRMVMEKDKEDDMGACIEKLDKMGWGAEEPIYDTALLLFGQSADYRKLWLHLKPESCGKWVKNAGSMFGLLD